MAIPRESKAVGFDPLPDKAYGFGLHVMIMTEQDIRQQLQAMPPEQLMFFAYDRADLWKHYNQQQPGQVVNWVELLMRHTPLSVLRQLARRYGTFDYPPLPPQQCDWTRLPQVWTNQPVGREAEFARLDEAWDTPETQLLVVVAWGGSGKTTLLHHWLQRLARENYRGAQRVYGWSFYQQGSQEGSAESFFNHALAWFGGEASLSLPFEEKARRLADLILQQPTLLILDGLEPLQQPQIGQLKDPAMTVLLRKLAQSAAKQSLCLISTRQMVADVSMFAPPTVTELALSQLSEAAGAQLLKDLDVEGSQAELTATSRELQGHALSLTLLGTYLRDVEQGQIARRQQVGLGQIVVIDPDNSPARHAYKVIQAYLTQWGEASVEVAILRLLGLFDRPAEADSIDVLRQAPPIVGMTEALFTVSIKRFLGLFPGRTYYTPIPNATWETALRRLHKARLIASADPKAPLDTHPLIRDYMAQEQQRRAPAAWRDAHDRLYRYLTRIAKKQPDTLEELAPLYAAITHGCRAGHYQEVHDEVHFKRIRRGNEYYSVNKLGAFGAELAALTHFFEQTWDVPVNGLREDTKAVLLNQVGAYLRALGRLTEASQPMQADLQMAITQKDWKGAAISASNLSELQLTLGQMQAAIETAAQSVDYADRSGDKFWRMGSCTTLANALHQAGRWAEAEALFQAAEAIQKDDQPDYPLLYSLPGFRYCDLLLTQGDAAAVKARAAQMFKWRTPGDPLLDIALDHLSLGLAWLPEVGAAPTGEAYQTALQHLNEAVEGFRKAGTQHHLPRGLLGRAALLGQTGQVALAQQDLREAWEIARREMRLFQVDIHLAWARLMPPLSPAETGGTRAWHLAQAATLIQATGYLRRERELRELESKE